MADRPEVHVGDVGTQYRVRIIDEDGTDFDPSDADVMELVFKLAGGGVVRKGATLEVDSPAGQWFLTYTVVANDGVGSPPGDFHPERGRMKVQAYLEWGDGRKFSSDVVSVDTDGRDLMVYENLED